MGAWLNKLQYIHTIAIKMDELLIHVTTEMNLQRIMLSGKKKKKPIPKCYRLRDFIYITFLQ